MLLALARCVLPLVVLSSFMCALLLVSDVSVADPAAMCCSWGQLRLD